MKTFVSMSRCHVFFMVLIRLIWNNGGLVPEPSCSTSCRIQALLAYATDHNSVIKVEEILNKTKQNCILLDPPPWRARVEFKAITDKFTIFISPSCLLYTVCRGSELNI